MYYIIIMPYKILHFINGEKKYLKGIVNNLLLNHCIETISI